VMHYSAKHSVAIACRPSICLSVTLVDQDHIGWKYWKPIARTISPTPSLFVAQRQSANSQEILGRLEVGWGKSGMLKHKSRNISDTRKDRGKVAVEVL